MDTTITLIDTVVNPDNLKHHATARLTMLNGVHGSADWSVAQWQKALQKQEKPDVILNVCGICEKSFEKNDNPYIAEFRDKNSFIRKIICKSCAYDISRTVIESDGLLHNGKQKFPKHKCPPKIIPVIDVMNDE